MGFLRQETQHILLNANVEFESTGKQTRALADRVVAIKSNDLSRPVA
jgi:hypothetical protein